MKRSSVARTTIFIGSGCPCLIELHWLFLWHENGIICIEHQSRWLLRPHAWPTQRRIDGVFQCANG